MVREKPFRLVRRKRAPAAPGRATPLAPEVTLSEAPAAEKTVATAPSPAADDRLTAQERAARVRALKEGLAKTESPGKVSEVVAQKNTGKGLSSVAENPIKSTEELSPPEAAIESPATPETIAARRAAELAELKEIEAGEERRRSEKVKNTLM